MYNILTIITIITKSSTRNCALGVEDLTLLRLGFSARIFDEGVGLGRKFEGFMLSHSDSARRGLSVRLRVLTS